MTGLIPGLHLYAQGGLKVAFWLQNKTLTQLASSFYILAILSSG